MGMGELMATPPRQLMMALTLLAILPMGQTTALADIEPQVRLRERSAVTHDVIMLRDVAELRGGAEAFADVQVGLLLARESQTVITLDTVRKTLQEKNVNWGKWSLGGFAACRVSRMDADDAAVDAAIVADHAAPALINPNQRIDLATPVSVHQRLVRFMEMYSDAPAGDLTIRFSESDQKALAEPALDDRWEFEPLTAAPLGRIPVAIRRWREDQLVREYRVTADVSRRCLAVVTLNSLRRGQMIEAQDVEIREVVVSDGRGLPLSRLDQAVGQVCDSILRANMPVYAGHLKPPLLVQRGELISVRCIQGGIVLKVTARALEEGGRDQLIKVRSEGTGATLIARVTGARQAATVGGVTPGGDPPSPMPSVVDSQSAAPPALSGFDTATGRIVLQ